MRKRRKRIVCSFLIFSLALSVPVLNSSWLDKKISGEDTVLADTRQELEDQKTKAQNDLKKTQDQIDGLNDDKSQVQSNLDSKSAELEKLVAAQKQLVKDMDAKQAEIDQSQVDLANAQAEVDKQYEAMKLRIQFMYENSTGDSLWTAILEAKGFSDMLNRLEYVSSINKSDRKLMDDYQNAVTEVENKVAQLNSEMDDMVALQDDYDAKQASVESMIAELQEQKEQYASQIAAAQSQADAYQDRIDELGKKIQEAERRDANAGAGYNGGGTGAGGVSDGASGNENPAQTTNISGADVVAYARQFVGKPYVWGGTSLTNGCDCSGFVGLVFAHFGVFSESAAKTHAFTSASLRSVGQKVGFDSIQPGDIVCYPGHVAIYAGNGVIVEAQSTSAGITYGRSVTCHNIITIRRVI